MALDGIVVASIVKEMSSLLVGNKIEKVHQPEMDELMISIRSQGKNQKLLLSSSSQYTRVHFTNIAKENPIAPPNFCMLLRKHLQGGRIIAVEQPSFERMIKFVIESYDELNVLKQKYLIIEMMGKHSNIICVDAETNKILDSIKRVSFDVSRQRQVLPGLTYQLPPSQDKFNPLEVAGMEAFTEALKQNLQPPAFKGIYTTFTGISPLVAREICYRANIPEDRPLLALEDKDFAALYHSFKTMMDNVGEGNFYPAIYIDDAKDKYVDFNVLPMEHLSYYRAEKFETISELLDDFYKYRDSKERMKQRTQDLRKNISLKLERLNNKIENLHKDLDKAEKAEECKIYGDLLTANIHLLKDKASEVSVIDYYDPEMKEITISLDNKLTPAQNAQKYFKQYNKYKTAMTEVAHQIEISQEEINYLEQILISIENVTHPSDIEEIQRELIETGYLKRKVGKKNNQQSKKSTYLKYLSSDGFEIYVGKNNIQNDELTFKVSSKTDLWLHVKDMAGSHTILKLNDGEYTDQALLEAATLAAYYSKGKNSTKVPVDYTLRKNVRKPSGAKPGMVIYDQFQTVYVDGDLTNIREVKEI
ncbi:Rqc2 family fibronectin-binding protein [Alkaliphilus hydrothermalis]|uniref:Rqc2 homolog RqcH n=1 Tax=Alkaliphilus hydrothermalis TaxID=1482730 RepID=A0ABS2NNK0_9FIRM|nr:NFACT RNA binding domain-containing protein [Alkaliphilus hydrothermalis]MBM7614521.1 putative ribosome quality control (RQC) complex YloA/Tae2 family protein [Alkaliphilus hydrothermalis]